MLKNKQRKMIAAGSAAIFAVSAAVSAAPQLSAMTVGGDTSIVILGDSISSGYALQEGELGYYDYLADAYHCTLANHAVSGATTSDLLAKLNDDAVKSDVSAADLICLSIGGNDLLQPAMAYFKTLQLENEALMDTMMRLATEGSAETHMSNLTGQLRTPIAAAQENILTIASTLKEMNPNAKIVFQTIYNPLEIEKPVYNGKDYSSEYKLLSNYINGQLRRLNNKIAEAASSADNVKVADVNAAFLGNGWVYARTLQKDVHPNALGHALIASLVMDAVGDEKIGSDKLETLVGGMILSGDAKALPADDYALLKKYTAAMQKTAFGDVNGNGSIEATDSMTALMAAGDMAFGLAPAQTLGQLLLSDVDSNGLVDAKDAQYILIYSGNTNSLLECTWQEVTGSPYAPTYSNLTKQ